MSDEALERFDIVNMSYDEKIKLLERIAQTILNKAVEFSNVAGEYMRLKMEMQAYNNAKSALQSAIRAERSEM